MVIKKPYKNKLQTMEFDDDFLNSEEFNNLDEHSKNMLRKLFELNEIKKSDLESSFKGQPGMFVQRLDDQDFNIQMDAFISQYNMTQDISIVRDSSIADEVIEEIWTSEDGLIKLKRYYELSYENINLLRPESRKMVHDILLEESLEKEDYETAAEIRDSIYLNE